MVPWGGRDPEEYCTVVLWVAGTRKSKSLSDALCRMKKLPSTRGRELEEGLAAVRELG